jgi:hypothetical protein
MKKAVQIYRVMLKYITVFAVKNPFVQTVPGDRGKLEFV